MSPSLARNKRFARISYLAPVWRRNPTHPDDLAGDSAMARSFLKTPSGGAAWFESAGESFAAARSRTTNPPSARPTRSHRTIFISDTHLGTRGCKAEALADFLAHNECGTLFLVR